MKKDPMQIALITFFFCAATTGAIMGGCLLGKKQQDAAAQQIYQKLEEAVIVPGKDNAENLQMDYLPEFDEEMLKDQNHEYAAWIYIPDTVISYPVVFPEDNKTYLTQGFEKNRHSYGCLFFDASAKPFSMVNTVIHGHNMRSGDMFGSLKNYLKQDYADQHTELYLLIDGKWNHYELLAAYRTSQLEVFPYRNTFMDESDFTQYMDGVKERSGVNAGIEITENTGELLTLSTCHGKKEKMIVQWLKQK